MSSGQYRIPYIVENINGQSPLLSGSGSYILNKFSGAKMSATDQSTIKSNVNIDLSNHKIVNIINPTNAQDAATKSYVDARISSSDSITNQQSGASMQATSSNTIKSNSTLDMSNNKIISVMDGSASSSVVGKGYVDSNISQAITSSNTYTDSTLADWKVDRIISTDGLTSMTAINSQITANQKIDMQIQPIINLGLSVIGSSAACVSQVNQSVTDSQAYTDGKSTGDRTYTDQKSTDAVNQSKTYTDNKSTVDRSYTEQKSTDAINQSKTYTDTQLNGFTSDRLDSKPDQLTRVVLTDVGIELSTNTILGGTEQDDGALIRLSTKQFGIDATIGMNCLLDMGIGSTNARIKNMANPMQLQDAVTLNYLNTTIQGYLPSQIGDSNGSYIKYVGQTTVDSITYLLGFKAQGFIDLVTNDSTLFVNNPTQNHMAMNLQYADTHYYLNTKTLDQIAIPNNNLQLNGKRIVDLSNAIGSTDATTLQQVQSLITASSTIQSMIQSSTLNTRVEVSDADQIKFYIENGLCYWLRLSPTDNTICEIVSNKAMLNSSSITGTLTKPNFMFKSNDSQMITKFQSNYNNNNNYNVIQLKVEESAQYLNIEHQTMVGIGSSISGLSTPNIHLAMLDSGARNTSKIVLTALTTYETDIMNVYTNDDFTNMPGNIPPKVVNDILYHNKTGLTKSDLIISSTGTIFCDQFAKQSSGTAQVINFSSGVYINASTTQSLSQYGFLNPQGNVGVASAQTAPVSLKCVQRVVCSEINLVSSLQAKEKLANPDIDLLRQKFMSMPFKEYEYRDKLMNDGNRHVGLIAEYTRELFDHLVVSNFDYAPNIMKIYNVIDHYVELEYDPIFVDKTFKLLIDGEWIYRQCQLIDDRLLISVLEKDDKVLVYGYYCDIPTINKTEFSEIVAIIVQDQQKTIEDQEKRIKRLEDLANLLMR